MQNLKTKCVSLWKNVIYRGEYYKHYTGQNWYDARNYDLCLDSSKLGFEGCVEAIKAYMAVRGLSIEK